MTKNSLYLFILLPFIMLVAACDKIQLPEKWLGKEVKDEREVVARVKDKFLYKDDLKGLISSSVSKMDSANIVGRYIDNWVRKQLMIAEAASNIDFDMADIERKILDYRFALMVYEYEKFYIQNQLDMEVTQEEINEYYEDNMSNFELKQNIIRGYFLKLDKEAPRMEQVRKLVKSKEKKDKDELRSYCFRFAQNYTLEDSVWINFDEIIKNTPFTSITNKVQFLRTNTYVEESDDDFIYILNIKEYKISDQISPVEFVADHIKNIILNKRKVELSKNLEEKVYKKAVENREFEIYEAPRFKE